MNKQQIIDKIDTMSIEEILKEDDQSILHEEFSFLNESIIAGIVGALIRIAFERSRVVKYIEQGKKLCDKYEGKKKQKCLQDVKKIELERKIKALRNARSQCSGKFDDSEKIKQCKSIINTKITKSQQEYKKTVRWLGAFQPTAMYGNSKGI